MFKRILISVVAIISASCSAQSIEKSTQNWESITTRILRNPKLLSKNWEAISPLIPHCSKIESTELECKNVPGIQKIHLEQGETGTIIIEYGPPADCKNTTSLAQDILGKPSKTWSDCQMDWNLKKIDKGLKARLANSKKSPERIFLTIGYEQTP